MPGVPLNWHDDGTTLVAPNGIAVIRGFRGELLAKGWNPANLPLTIERGASTCDPTDPHSGPGTQQYFTDTLLVWSAATNAIMRPHLGALAQRLADQLALAQTPAPLPAAIRPKISKVKADLAVVEQDVADAAAAVESGA